MKLIFVFNLIFILHAGVMKAQSQTVAYTLPVTTAYTQSILLQAAQASQASFSSASLDEALKMQTERHGLEKTGRIMTFIGVPLMMIGGVLIYNSQNLYKKPRCSGRHGCLYDPQAPLGYTLLATSTVMTFTGVMFWIHGSKKTKKGIL